MPTQNLLASCSNDETIKLWTIDGGNIETLTGHTGFVFDVKALSTGELISGGDDKTVKVIDFRANRKVIYTGKTSDQSKKKNYIYIYYNQSDAI